MVGVTIDCRLGNQLFQYAFIKALSKKLNSPFFVNENIEKFILADYFNIEGYHPLTNFIRRVIFKLTSRPVFQKLQNIVIDSDDEVDFNALCDKKIYRGYFQSEFYFRNIVSDISDYISVKKKFKQQFTILYGKMFSENKIIAVHVRRGDYANLNDWWAENLGSHDLTLPVDYYLHCLEHIPYRQDYKIIFISDDMEFVQSAFHYMNNAEFVSNDMIIDFQILMNADICITSNSSFSWWASYLNPNKHKKIYCPEYWLGYKIKREYPRHIIPSAWMQMNGLCN